VRLRGEAYGISESFCVALEVWNGSFFSDCKKVFSLRERGDRWLWVEIRKIKRPEED
jgi:hypothetical protein